jgi:hypothetical protein
LAVHGAGFASFLAHCPLLQKPSIAQSVSMTHVVVHAPFVHRNGSQSVVPFGLQAPEPLQRCPVTTVPVHVLAPQLAVGG